MVVVIHMETVIRQHCIVINVAGHVSASLSFIYGTEAVC